LPKNNKRSQVTIGDDTWIGTGAIILTVVSIVESSVVGAGKVVSKNMED